MEVMWARIEGRTLPTIPLLRKRSSFRVFLGLLRISAPSTLPTPSQVIVPFRALNDAMLIAAARVVCRLRWQRKSRWITCSKGEFFKVPTAILAAMEASLPRPNPSTTATKTPPGNGATTY